MCDEPLAAEGARCGSRCALRCCRGMRVAQDLLIRNATVHTADRARHAAERRRAGARRRDPRGRQRTWPAGRRAGRRRQGRPLTPALFGGITEHRHRGSLRREAAPSTARRASAPTRNGDDGAPGVRRDAGLQPGVGADAGRARRRHRLHPARARAAPTGGSIIGGQGGVVRLDGSLDPIGPRVLFVHLGGGASALTGNSRAAQWMILDQLVDEARGRIAAGFASRAADAGRTRDAGELPRRRRPRRGRRQPRRRHPPAAALVASATTCASRSPAAPKRGSSRRSWPRRRCRCSSIRWPTCRRDFDQIGATLENAARLHAAGVAVGFTQFGDASHNARKIRQLAGNAVANGLPWDDGLAGADPRAGARPSASAASSAASRRASAPTWCCGAATRSRSAPSPSRSGSTAARSDALAPDRTARPLPA